MTNPRPITDHKAAFLRSQIRLLSRPLQPSPSFQDVAPYQPALTTTAENTDDDAQPQKPPAQISDKVAQEIADKVNAKIRGHNRLVFSAQSQRHVAEQIDTLYWNEVLSDDLRADTDTTWVKRVVDLTESDAASSLPLNIDLLYLHPRHDKGRGRDRHKTSQEQGDGEENEDEDEGEDEEDQIKQRYTTQRERLVELCKKRDKLRETVEMYRQLRTLLEPFEDAKVNVQPNLVTRDGELAKELEKMRVLLARVGSKVAGLQQRGDTEMTGTDSTRKGASNQEKLDAVFGAG